MQLNAGFYDKFKMNKHSITSKIELTNFFPGTAELRRPMLEICVHNTFLVTRTKSSNEPANFTLPSPSMSLASSRCS